MLLRSLTPLPRKDVDGDRCAEGGDDGALEPLHDTSPGAQPPLQNGTSNFPAHHPNGRRTSSRSSIVAENDNISACGVSVSGMCMVSADTELRFSRDNLQDSVLRDKCVSSTSCDKLRSSSLFLHSRRGSAAAPLHGNAASTGQDNEVPLVESAAGDTEGAAPSLTATIIGVISRDLQLLRNKYFISVTFSAVGFFFVFSTFIIIIPDYAVDQGLTESDGVFLLSVYGISDLLSKPIPGLLAYKKLMSNKGIFIAGGFITGLLMLIMPFMHTYVSFVLSTLMFGLVTGGLIFMSPVLLTEFLGPQLAVMAFGMSNLFIGLASLLRPFIIGNVLYSNPCYHIFV